MKIVILGATSHVAKGLIRRFSISNDCRLTLFARNIEKLQTFLDSNEIHDQDLNDFSSPLPEDADVIINCVGYGKASAVASAGIEMFRVFDQYDELCLKFIEKHSDVLYLYFSSGAIYGTGFSDPVHSGSIAEYAPNSIDHKDYYRVIKLYTETKHRSLTDHKIWDIRIFNYLSEDLDLNDRTLITDIINCLNSGSTFYTSDSDIIRDFVHPDDLFQLTSKIIENDKGNGSVDLYSRAPISKLELVKFLEKEHGLKVDIHNVDTVSPTGLKSNYYSRYQAAEELFSYFPEYDSRSVIEDYISNTSTH